MRMRIIRGLKQSAPFSSLQRRIIFFNLIGLALLVMGVMYLNQFRSGLIEMRVGALRTQGLPRIYGALGLWSLAVYLAFNAGYYQWWGGYAMGPRLLLPVFAALPLGFVALCARETPAVAWRGLLALGVLSIVLSLPLSLLEPEIPNVYDNLTLRAATPSSELAAPQFGYWRHFFSEPNWWTATERLRVERILSFGGAALLPLALLVWGYRRLGRPTNPAAV